MVVALHKTKINKRRSNNVQNVSRIYHKDVKKQFVSSRLEDQVEKNAVFHTTGEKQTNIGSTCSLQRTKLLLFKGKKAAALNILNPQHRPFGGETDACPGHCAVEEGNRIITDVSFLCLHTSE